MSQNELLSHWMTLAVAYRSFIAAVGLVFAVMGYRLYCKGITRGSGEAEIRTVGTIRTSGPGAFFCFFGMALVCVSLWTPPRIRVSDAPEIQLPSAFATDPRVNAHTIDPDAPAIADQPTEARPGTAERVVETNFDPSVLAEQRSTGTRK